MRPWSEESLTNPEILKEPFLATKGGRIRNFYISRTTPLPAGDVH